MRTWCSRSARIGHREDPRKSVASASTAFYFFSATRFPSRIPTRRSEQRNTASEPRPSGSGNVNRFLTVAAQLGNRSEGGIRRKVMFSQGSSLRRLAVWTSAALVLGLVGERSARAQTRVPLNPLGGYREP